MGMQAERIDDLVARIVQAVHPLRILLFGSAARGDSNETSDVDVLVVMPEGIHRRRTAQNIYAHIWNLGVPVDVVVATPSDLDKYRDTPGLIYRSILREGRELYVSS